MSKNKIYRCMYLLYEKRCTTFLIVDESDNILPSPSLITSPFRGFVSQNISVIQKLLELDGDIKILSVELCDIELM